MKKKPASKSAFFNQRVLIGFSFCLIGLVLALLAFAAYPGGKAFARQEQADVQASDRQTASARLEAPDVIGVCDTAGPVEVEATAGTLGPTAYPNLAAAIAAINLGTHQGVINVEICGSTVETAAMVLHSTGAGAASYTSVLIRPLNDGLTVAGPTVVGRGLIELNGADNVTIDGDNPNTAGTNRNLTIQNNAANTVNFTSVVRVALAATVVTSADNVTIRNCNFIGSGTGRNINTATSTTGPENTTFGIFAGAGASTVSATTDPSPIASVSTGVGAGATGNNLTITNNNFSGSMARAISVNGSATTVFPGLLINNNTIGNVTAGSVDQVTSIGITVQGSTNAVISGNTVYVEGFVASSVGSHGIEVGVNSTQVTGATIERNKVSRVRANETQTWSAYGINLGGGNGHVVQNNFVFDVRNDQTAGTGAFSTTFGAFGIRVGSGTGHQVLYNSVHLSGVIPGAVSTDLVAAFMIAGTGQTGMDVRNNIFSNVMTGGNPTQTNTRLVAISLPSAATVAMNLTLNNNDYVEGTDANSRMAYVGTSTASGEFTAANFDPANTTPATNFRAYTSTLSAAGTNDNASKKVNPLFLSNTDLHLAAGSPMDNGGTPLIVLNDIDGDLRSVVTPEIGADEIAGAPSPTPTPTVTPATPTPSPTPTLTPTPTSTISPSPSATATPSPGGGPANDQCAGAIVIPPAGPFPFLTAAVDITNATTTGDPPLPSCQTSVSRSIWYTFTPAVTGSYTISSCQTEAPASSLPDIVLAIYTSAAGCAGPFTQLAGVAGCDDDSCTTLALQAIISNTTLNAGTQYYILAHKFGAGAPVAPADDIQFRVSLATPVSPTPTPSGTITPTPTPTVTPGTGCSVINGGLNPQPLTESGVAAPAGFFWSEVQHDTGNLAQANTNAGYADTQGANRLADDFTITQTCNINDVVFYGYLTGAPATPSPFTAYTLQIWNGRPGDPGATVVFGDTTTNRLASSTDSTFFRIFNTVVPPPGTAQGTTRKIWRNSVTVGITLPAGTYWVDWASTVTGAANHFAPAKTIAGSRGAAGDNARQFATGAWTDVVDAGFPAGGTPVPQDFPFEVNGSPFGGTPPPTPTPTTTPTPTATPSPCGVNTFSNPAAISIPDSGPGTPYPSNINVAGLTGTVTKVTVSLNNLTHSFPADLDILLVSPGGQNAIIMSDVGGGDDVTSITLTLDDAAAAVLPAALLTSGTFRPTNAGAGDTWPAPAPAPAGGSPLSVFNGGNPNGTWALYLVDDAAQDLGNLSGGWTINISTTTGVCATPTPGTPTPTPSCPPATNVIVDGTFEAGTPWVGWTVQTSTNFGTPMCDAGCGTGGGTAGGFGGSANWAWFGGTASAETATTGQSVVIASGGVASLTFQMWIGAVNAPFTDVLNVRVDGTIVQSFAEPAVAEPGYTQRTIDVGAFANGASHAILFEYIGPGGAVSNFSVDNVTLVAGGTCPTPTPGTPTPTPSVTPSTPTPTPTPGTPSPTATVEPSASPTATVGVTPSPTAPATSQAVNLSTRMRVQTGDRVGIGGFIITGGTKQVLVRAIGPSLTRYKIEDVLADPILELHGPTGFTTVVNDNWRVPNGPAIQATGIPPTNDLESAILATLNPGQYTAIIKGVGNTSGVGLVEVYDLTPGSGRLANISTRAFVSTGDNIVIAGFVLDDNSGDGSTGPDSSVIIRGIGPSLTAAGVSSVLADPTLELRNSDGTLLISNNDWQDNAAQAALITAAGLAPSNNLEAAIAATLPPGLYTALLAGLNNTSGNGLVEVYDLGASGGGPGPSPTPPPPGTPTPTPPPASPSPGVTPPPTSPTPTPPPASPTPTPPSGPCTESFDGVTPPTLPAGWTSAVLAGDPPPWVTTGGSPDVGNNAFVADQDGISDKVLDSRSITINSASSVLTFRNNFNTEYDPPPAEVFWDGYVLEVSTDGGGSYNDVIAAGGVFVSGPYTGEIDGSAENPLAGRMAWSGNSGGYINSVINLPASFNGQTIKLRFRMGTDQAIAAPGAHVDGLSITNAACP